LLQLLAGLLLLMTDEATGNGSDSAADSGALPRMAGRAPDDCPGACPDSSTGEGSTFRGAATRHEEHQEQRAEHECYFPLHFVYLLLMKLTVTKPS
jgi:hypothetical protein